MVKNHYHGSVAEPRARLLQAVLRFVLDARICQGVLRMGLIGSLTIAKPLAKDADVLVTIEDGLDLGPAFATIASAIRGSHAVHKIVAGKRISTTISMWSRLPMR